MTGPRIVVFYFISNIPSIKDQWYNNYARRWNHLEGSEIKSGEMLISPLNHQSKRNCPEEETGKGRRQPAGRRSSGRCLMSWSHYCCFSVGTLMITLTR